MIRKICATMCVLALAVLAGNPGAGAVEDIHAYYNSLVSSPAHWKSYSLRTQAQLLEFKNANSVEPHVNYDPAADAAKVVIPAFKLTADANGEPVELAEPLAPGDTYVKVNKYASSWWTNNRGMRIGNEVLRVVRPSGTIIADNRIPVARGQGGTTAASHAIGAPLSISINSLQNQVRLPLGTQDGHTYFFVWDARWTSSYLNSGLSNHKTFQFSAGNGLLWLEPQTRFDGGGNDIPDFNKATDVAALEMRAYLSLNGPETYSDALSHGKMGAGVTDAEPIMPMARRFTLKPDRWTRFFVRIEQHANDYDYMSYWVADEQTNATQIYNRVPLTIKGDRTIDKFWLEFNTSTDNFVRGNTRDLVAYVRNFVALRNASNVETLLHRPGAGVPIPPDVSEPTATIAAPTGVRIVR